MLYNLNMVELAEPEAKEIFDTAFRYSQWRQAAVEKRIGLTAMLATGDQFEAFRQGDLRAADDIRDGPQLRVEVEVDDTARKRFGTLYGYELSLVNPWNFELRKGNFYTDEGETTLAAQLRADGSTEILKMRRGIDYEKGEKIKAKLPLNKWDTLFLIQAGIRLRRILPILESEEQSD